MNKAVINHMRSMSRHLSDIQDDVENCQAGLAFLGYVFKACKGMTIDEESAKGLGYIIHTMNIDLVGTDADFDELRKFFGSCEEEQAIDLDQMGGHGPAKG